MISQRRRPQARAGFREYAAAARVMAPMIYRAYGPRKRTLAAATGVAAAGYRAWKSSRLNAPARRTYINSGGSGGTGGSATITVRRNKRRRRKKPFTQKRKIARLSKQVSSLNKERQIEWIRYRKHDVEQLLSLTGECKYTFWILGPEDRLKESIGTTGNSVYARDVAAAPDAQVVTTPGTQLSTFKKMVTKFLINNMYLKVDVRNNGNFPCNLTVYEYVCIDDASVGPYNVAITDSANWGISDWATNVDFTMTSFKKLVSEYFRLVSTKNVHLLVGQEASFSTKRKQYTYTPVHDATIGQYKKGMKVLVFRVQGVICHDKTVETQISYAPAQIDMHIKHGWNIKPLQGVYEAQMNVYPNENDTVGDPVVGNITVQKEDDVDDI